MIRKKKIDLKLLNFEIILNEDEINSFISFYKSLPKENNRNFKIGRNNNRWEIFIDNDIIKSNYYLYLNNRELIHLFQVIKNQINVGRYILSQSDTGIGKITKFRIVFKILGLDDLIFDITDYGLW